MNEDENAFAYCNYEGYIFKVNLLNEATKDKQITAIVPYNIANTISSLKSIYGRTKIEVKLVNNEALSSLTDVHIKIKELEGPPQMTKA